jgi:hypothetical protein
VSSSIPLTSAVSSGNESAVSALLANGADVNETSSGGRTPLILAVIYGHTNIVQRLVQAGADPQQRDDLGLNAIEWAQRRGLREALDILTNTQRASTSRPKKIVINFEEPEEIEEPAVKSCAPEPEVRDYVSEDEKSRRWIAGLKQRLDEQELRRLNRNESFTAVRAAKPPEPEPEPEEPQIPEPVSEPPTPRYSTRILTPAPPSTPTGNRKRCPKCNAVYNGDLVSYCAVDMSPLIDADAPLITEPRKSNPPLFWILIIVTLVGSIVIGSLITRYFYRSNQEQARVAATQQPLLIKGVPEVGPELAGKAVYLPEAECPVRGPEPVSGTVTVQVAVDKNGQVYRARGAGGDWLMRGAANEAAMKSTFSAEKLRRRETEGTIIYTFKP